MAYEIDTEPLQMYLHELAEGLQAASNYLGTLRNGARQAGSNQTVEAAIVEKVAQQLARAEKGSVVCVIISPEANEMSGAIENPRRRHPWLSI